MEFLVSAFVLIGVSAGAAWAAYLVSKDFEPEVGKQRSQIYGALFFVSLPALAAVRLLERRRGR
jgi:hypothetical protein